MKFWISLFSFYILYLCLYAQNEHIYKQLSQTYLVKTFPYKVKLALVHPLMRFEDSVLIDIYQYQTYYDSKYQRTHKQDSITLFEYTFKQEGWYSIFVFTKQGKKLYETSVLLLYKPEEHQKNTKNSKINASDIQFEWQSEDILFQNDSLIMVHRKRRNYVFKVKCSQINTHLDMLHIKVYKIDKRNKESLFCEWEMNKLEDTYQIEWTIKRKELGKYRFSIFDPRKYWYGSKEIDIQESK